MFGITTTLNSNVVEDACDTSRRYNAAIQRHELKDAEGAMKLTRVHTRIAVAIGLLLVFIATLFTDFNSEAVLVLIGFVVRDLFGGQRRDDDE